MSRVSSLLFAAALAVCGCAEVRVTRVDSAKPDKAVGVRYSLPKPFVLAHQDPATGKVSCEIVYLPDEENTYALHIGGLMDSRKATVQLDDQGMLRQIDYTVNTTVVAAKLAEVGGTLVGTVEKARQDRAVAKAKALADAQAARTTAASELEGQVTTANDAVTNAEAAVRKAQFDKQVADEALKADPSNQTLQADVKLKNFAVDEAQQTLDHAKATRDVAAAKLDALRAAPLEPTPVAPTAGTFTPAASSAAATLPTHGSLPDRVAAADQKFVTGASPVLYAVLEGVEKDHPEKRVVRLRAVGVESDDGKLYLGRNVDYPVSAAGGTETTRPVSDVTLTPVPPRIKPGERLRLTSNKPLRSVTLDATNLTKRNGSNLEVDKTLLMPLPTFTEFEIGFKAGGIAVPGKYELQVRLTPEETATATTVLVPFEIGP